MKSQAFTGLVAAAATLLSGGCSQVLRATFSRQAVTHLMAVATIWFLLPRDIRRAYSAISRLRPRAAESRVATHPVYKVQ